LDLNQLEVLVAVAREKGFSRAADRLNRTQPAVSQAIRRLEDAIDERLIDRSSRDGKLTDAGELLYDYAQQMLNLRRDAAAAVHELLDLQRGKVTISANEYIVTYLLPVIAVYRARHPHVKIEVKRSLSSRIPAEIVGRDVEMGVLSFKPPDAALKVVLLTMDELALIVAPDHPLAGRAEVSVRELGVESFVAHNVRSPYRERVVKTFEKYRTPLNISIELPTLESIKRLVEQGMGVALMPRSAARVEVERNQLAAVPVREMKLERRLFLVYRRDAKLSHAAVAFIKAIRAVHRPELV